MELKLTAGMYWCTGRQTLLLVFLAALVLASSLMPLAMAQSANRPGMTTYIGFNANTPSVNWDLFKVSASCAALDGTKPLKWRSKYFWTAFCLRPHGAYKVCGMCLQVTNADTGARATVRIVDDCRRLNVQWQWDVLAMDTPVFNLIANDGHGAKNNGHLAVNYQFVNCDD